MMISVGIWSFGVALCLAGVGLLVGNLTGSMDAARLADFWGLIPLFLGVELLVAQYRAHRRSASGEPTRVKLHTGSLAGLMVLVVVAAIVNVGFAAGGWTWNWGDWSWGSYAQEASTNVSADFNVTEGAANATTVVLHVPPGQWTINGADVSELSVEADLTARAATLDRAETAAQGAKLEFRAEGSSIRLVITVPGYEGETPRSEVQLDIFGTLTIPKGLGLQFETSTAGVTANDIGGRIRVDTATGDIDITNAGGDVTVSSSTGSVTVDGANGAADLSSTTGSIDVSGVTGNMRVDSTTGSILLSGVAGALDVDTMTGFCTVNASGPLAGDWSIGSQTGAVDVSFPQASDVSVRVNTGTGAISCNLGFTIETAIAHQSMQGTLGAATYEMVIDSTTGAVTINGQ